MPCSQLKLNRSFGRNVSSIFKVEENAKQETNMKQGASILLITCFLSLKKATRYTETSADSQRTTWRYIPEDRTLHNHRCENLIS
jgi:hypothetical protein